MITAILIAFLSVSLSHQQLIIIDGDTIRLDDKKIRLIGIDAPEMNQFCYDKNEAITCGELSKQKLEELIVDREIFCLDEGKDRYRRTLSECFVPTGSESVPLSLNKAMVSTGWAVAYRKYSKRYIQAEEFARSNRLGMWQYKFEMPWNWRK